MATTINTIYPPQVDTFMPSFCYNEPAVVWFNISSYNEDMIDKIKYIHVSMVDQRNNINVFAGLDGNDVAVYPQYYPIACNLEKENNNNPDNKMGYNSDKQMYWLTIPPQILKTAPYYNIGQYYKVQLRFDLTGSEDFLPQVTGYEDPTVFFFWENNAVGANALKLASYTNYNIDNFSEWSTGTLLKPILIPELLLQNFSTSQITEINRGTDISLIGKIIFEKDINDNNSYIENEKLLWYQIIVDNFSSNKIYSEEQNNEFSYLLDTSQLIIDTNYQIQIVYMTNNGYQGLENFPIKIIDYQHNSLFTYTSPEIDEENGTIALNINSSEYSQGFLVIRRASYVSNFKQWDLIAAYDIENIANNNIEIIDNTIESMTGYKYQLQYISPDNELYRPIVTNIIHCDFYGGLFSDDKKTLKISFNFQLSNRANAINRSKTDTLGGQYPVFTKNAKLKYHTYNINGRISTEDNGELFLSKQEIFGTEYYNYRYNKTVTAPHISECQGIKPNADWLYEREYRDAVEEWLNNGEPKLFRSMTEGNMIVMLDSVSMTPDTVLGRRLYDFSATMYEIGNGKDLDSITSFGLFDIKDERIN